MIKKIITIMVVSILPLLAQEDFLEGVKAGDLMLDRIEAVPVETAKEIENSGFDYWFGPVLSVAYSPNTTLIAEERTEKPGGRIIGVWIVDSATNTEKRIIEGIAYDLKWSADGKFLAFRKMVPKKELFHGRRVYGDGGLWLYNVETDEMQPVPLGSYFEWSPQGNYLAGKHLDSTGLWALAIYNAEREETKVLDRVLFFEPWNFCWSPDGEMLTYVVATKTSGHIECSPIESEVFIINRDGTGKTQITYTMQPEILVKWLPDGKSIMVERFKEMPDPVTGGSDTEIVILKLKKRRRK